MTDFNNSNNKEESVQDTLRRVMTERGYFANPVTIHTEIGDFTSYADEDSPLVKKNQPQLNAHNPFDNTGGFGNSNSGLNNSSGLTNPTSTWSDNNGSFGNNMSNEFNTNANFVTNQSVNINSSLTTMPTLQNQTPTPWSNPAEQISPVPWRNNQTITPWAGGYDLSAPTQSNDIQSIDYSRYGEGFSKEFIDKMENDKEFQKILNEYIIPNEGGYNNDPVDTGGETNMGIAQNAHPNEDIKNMTRERANAIYYRDYYNWNGLNKLPYPIRGFVVDYGLPTNPQYALKTVHNVLGIPKNATIIGPTTLKSFEHYTDADYNDFLEKYREEMKKHYNNIAQKYPQKRKFLKGWLNRANSAHLAK